MSSPFQPTNGFAPSRRKVAGLNERIPRYEYKEGMGDVRDPVSSSYQCFNNPRELPERDHRNNFSSGGAEIMDNFCGNPYSSYLGSPNSIIEDNFNEYEGDCKAGDCDSLLDPKGSNIIRAKELLMRITCQESLTNIAPVKVREEVPQSFTKRPSLRKLHMELQQKIISDLQEQVQTKDALLNQVVEENNEMKSTLVTLNDDIAKIMVELEKMPRVRLHLELVESVNAKLHDIIKSRNAIIKENEKERREMRNEIQEAKLDMKQVEHDKGSLVRELRRRGECEKELRATNCLARSTKRELESIKILHKQELKDIENEHSDKELNLQVQLRALKMKHGLPIHPMTDESAPMGRDELRAMVQIKEESITALRNQVLASESTRRKLHNVIQELRGNIRVFVRVRPFLEHECQINRKRQIVTPINVVEAGNALTICGKNENATYEFDKVYGPTCTQEDVFEELSDFVQSALDGYSACIFAYGQTGSGKTHTMQGEGFGDMRGITPRAVEQILRASHMMKHTWNFYVQANFVEIYNEKLVDLLSGIKEEIEFFNSCEDEMLTLNPGINKGSDKLTLRKDVLGQTFVEGLTNVMIDINNFDKGMAMINSILKCAARARTVASTKMNDRSSRSHSVFTLDIAGKNIQSGAVTAGSLHLVDLAGSERLDTLDDQIKNSKQLKETTNINKSLSCLGDVFSALASDASHVPYRNSKLTYLLQNCLGGDGKACMVVNLSPTIASCKESMQSLRFAQRVSQIEMGRGTKKVHISK